MSTSGGAGGGPAPGSYIPVADPFGVTVVQQEDPSGTGRMINVLQFPTDQAALAIKLVGDLMPRWFLMAAANDGLYLGDGTNDPYQFGDGTSLIGLTSDDGSLNISSTGSVLLTPETDVGGVVDVRGTLQVDGEFKVFSIKATGITTTGFAMVDDLDLPTTEADLGVGPGNTLILPITQANRDITFDIASGPSGPVVVDSSDGHTYRLDTTAGVPTATLVT